MKTPSPSVLNSIGFTNDSQRAYYAAQLLAIASLPGAKVTIVPRNGSVAAIESPASVGAEGWESAIQFTYLQNQILINAQLPYETTPKLIGRPTDTVSSIKEFAPQVAITRYDGTKASNVPETKTINDEPTTVERYFYRYAKDLGATIENETRVVKGKTIPVKTIALTIASNLFDPGSDDFQLDKIGSGTVVVDQ